MATTNENALNYIHEDVAFSILSKLPLKSIRRFACICKAWALLFENPRFMDMLRKKFLSTHSMYNGTRLVLKYLLPEFTYVNTWYLCDGDRFETKIKLDLPPPCKDDRLDFIDLNILGSAINGFLCLYDFLGKVVLWKPDTGESLVIPPSHVESSLPCKVTAKYIHFTLCGFGYDHIGDDYKVIRHMTFRQDYFTYFKDGIPRNHYSWQIYSLKSNSWRNLEEDMPNRDISVGLAGSELYLNGICHWLGETYDNCVVSFNLTNEIFYTTPFSLDMCKSYEIFWELRHLLVLNGSIALISNHSKAINYFHIFILPELGVQDSWTKLFTVGPLDGVHCLIGAGNKADIIFVKYNNELACFDLKTQVSEEIGVQVVGLYGCQIAIYKKFSFPLEVSILNLKDFFLKVFCNCLYYLFID